MQHAATTSPAFSDGRQVELAIVRPGDDPLPGKAQRYLIAFLGEVDWFPHDRLALVAQQLLREQR
jgi:hypothetical protein